MRPVIPSFDGQSYLGWLENKPLAASDYTGAALTPGGFHSFEERIDAGKVRACGPLAQRTCTRS